MGAKLKDIIKFWAWEILTLGMAHHNMASSVPISKLVCMNKSSIMDYQSLDPKHAEP